MTNVTDPRLAQALAILDAIEKLPEGDVFHAGKVLGGNGAWFIRRERLSDDEVDRIAGTSGRDVLAKLGTVIEAEGTLAQLVQSHPEGV